MPDPAADMTVQLVPADGAGADAKVTVVADQVLTATPADEGKVVTVAADGTLELADPAPGGAAGFSIATASTALTTHTPNSTTMEQWGTEEATVAEADAGDSAVVLAWLTGSAGAGPGTVAVGDRGECRLEVSFDGGGSWATMGDAGIITTLVSTSLGTRIPLAATGRATGTPTGDVQVRAMVRDLDQANDLTFGDGIITVLLVAT